MINITANVTDLTGRLDAISERQLPFASMRALNEVATTFQQRQRAVLESTMTIRRPWVEQGVKIDRGDFATKEKLSVRIGIDPSRDFLDKFEPGGTRTPRAGGSLVVPLAARPSQESLIPNRLRPKSLGFHEVGGSALAKHASRLSSKSVKSAVLRGGMRVYEGNNRTILIQGANGEGVILQRVNGSRGRTVHVHNGEFHAQGVFVGRRDPGLRVLYTLRPRTRVPASLHFHETARSTFVEQWPVSFTRWWLQALVTAR